jgi:Taurine catabolism dioxygenase TauD, TfdA family
MGTEFKEGKESFTKELETCGWCLAASSKLGTEDLGELVQKIANKFGKIESGRGGKLVEKIVPQTFNAAYAGSLSNKYGLGPLPLHTETAHWPIPCRYVVIGCADAGPKPTPTVLLDVRQINLSKSEVSACESAVFLIRNGRRSFYGHLRERDRAFFRVDPGCMAPLTRDGEMALNAFSVARNERALYRHDWNAGEILIIDNWRVVHGRGGNQQTAHGRELLRAMVR